MNDEEKEVFNLIDGDEINDFRQPGFEIVADQLAKDVKVDMKVPEKKVEYEDIDDDFILMLNGGVPAVELLTQDDKIK